MKLKSTKTTGIVSLIRPGVRALTAYHVDETPVRVKLDAMENPFLLPASVRRQIASALRNAKVNLYPDPSAKDLKRSIASLWRMRPEQMILGNGSDELIQAIILAFGGPVLVPVPTFAMYEITSRALAQKVVTVPLTNTFDLDADSVLRKAKQSKARVIFLACPNNPTGNRFSDAAVGKVLQNTSAAVVIDEAYYSFSGRTWLPQLGNYPNMILLRTLSKIGFAGLRIGVLCASPEIVGELNKIRLPYNINSLSQAVGVAALRNRTVINAQIATLIIEREQLGEALAQLPGVTAYPSETNFILLRVPGAAEVHARLKKKGILVKNLDKPGPLKDCLRVTIGTPAENREFLKRLKGILAADERR
jgi:histidinol-phosphate aminotransferase